MKKLEFYKEYISYLEWRLENNKINKGEYSLLKFSRNQYDTFIKKLETNEDFNTKIREVVKCENRNNNIEKVIESDKIKDFFDEFDF